MAEKPRKISELPKIQNISNDDLLLVSDWDGGKCLSKKMSIQQFVQYIVNAVMASSEVTAKIQQQAETTATNVATAVVADKAQEAAENAVDTIVKNEIREKTVEVIRDYPEDIFDMIDGVKDQQMYINGGKADASA